MSSGIDYPLGETVHILFTTRSFSTGAPSTLSAATVSVYEDGTATPIETGVAVTEDFNSVTGLNMVPIVAIGGSGYNTGASYHVVIDSASTVGGVSVQGEVVGSFSIERAAALRPTTAGRTLDVAATGEAGLDFGNVTGTLSGGELAAGVFGAGAITATAIATGAIDADAIAANAIAAAKIATDAITADKIAADAITSSELAASAAQKIRDEILPTQNATFSNLMFLWVAASDHVTPVTGASGTAVTRSIDGAAFGSATGTLAEIGNGIYQFDASAADMNGGIITFRFTASGGTPGAPDDAFVTVVTGGGV